MGHKRELDATKNEFETSCIQGLWGKVTTWERTACATGASDGPSPGGGDSKSGYLSGGKS